MNSPFRVLGIALVVEGMGIGARLAFRYPVTAPSRVDDNSQDPERRKHEEQPNDLFFTLPPRVMAKIFRPKKPLCGQPMTVSVGGTVFCCRSVLLEDDDNHTTPHLILFSVIVALEPVTLTSAIPISGWFDADSMVHSDESHGRRATSASGRLASASFRSIRRVHVSMGRLCRALEREERRCQYVSTQSSLFLKLRKDLGLSDEGAKVDAAAAAAAVAATSTSNNPSATPKSGSSVVSTATTTAAPSDATKNRHRRMGSGSLIVSTIADQPSSGDHPTGTEESSNQDQFNYQEREQEALEVMLAAQSGQDETDEGDNGASKPVNGNLARELAQTFHALSRNDYMYVPTSMGLLSGQDGIVYINRHVAVPIESISGASFTFSAVTTDATTSPTGGVDMMDSRPVIRPYHTLLFPHATPSECLEAPAMSSSTAFLSKTAPQKLEQLLITATPHKSLSEISVDAAMPLASTLELAGYLVNHRICVLSPVLGRSSRLACCHDAVPKRLQALSLSFGQRFGPHLSIFLVVSVLTSHDASLGELMSRVSLSLDDDDETIALVGDRIVASLRQQQEHATKMSSPGLVEKSGTGVHGSPRLRPVDQSVVRDQDVEDVVYSMAVWLRAHHAIVDMKDYLVSVGVGVNTPVDKLGKADAAPPVATESNTNPENLDAAVSESIKGNNSLMERERIDRWDHNLEETLYNELLEAGCLNGNISTVALCWKFALDGRRLHRFRTWGFRRGVLRVVTRIPVAGDDWGAV